MPLAETFREDGKAKHRTIANLSGCSEEEIQARMPENLSDLSFVFLLERKPCFLYNGNGYSGFPARTKEEQQEVSFGKSV